MHLILKGVVTFIQYYIQYNIQTKLWQKLLKVCFMILVANIRKVSYLLTLFFVDALLSFLFYEFVYKYDTPIQCTMSVSPFCTKQISLK